MRLFIAEKGLLIPTVEVDLRARAQLEPAFLAKNPGATVPVPELDVVGYVYLGFAKRVQRWPAVPTAAMPHRSTAGPHCGIGTSGSPRGPRSGAALSRACR